MAKVATRERILDAALDVFARKGYHRALVAALGTFADNARLARLILLEAVSLGPVYQAKRAEVAGRFAALIQRYLDEAVADGSIPPLDTRVATLAWLGAVNEIVIQWLHDDVHDLKATIPALTRILLRSASSRAPRSPSASRRSWRARAAVVVVVGNDCGCSSPSAPASTSSWTSRNAGAASARRTHAGLSR